MGGGAPRDADARQADTYVASYGSRHACDGMALVAQYGLGGYHLSARKYKESAAAMCKLLWLPGAPAGRAGRSPRLQACCQGCTSKGPLRA